MLNSESSDNTFYDVLFINNSVNEEVVNPYEEEVLTKVRQIIEDKSELDRYIPNIPDIFMELMDELKQEHTDFKKIAKILSKDPIMSARVLALVNSAYYKRTNSDISNLLRAISVLGLDTVEAIFVSLMMKDLVQMNPLHYKMFGKQIWQHSMETAVVCQRLSRDFDIDSVFCCYLLGLMHDIGKVIIFQGMSELWYEQIQLKHLGSKPFKQELTKMSVELSRLTAIEWRLPEHVINGIANSQKLQHKDAYSKVLGMANRVSKLHLQVQANIVTFTDAHLKLLESGFSVTQANDCLREVISLPPI